MTSSSALRRRRILVVEDEPAIAEFLQETLQDAGATVIGPARTVVAALDLVRTEQAIDLALLDVNVHGERVFPVADALRDRHVPFVFMTGYSEAVVPSRYRAVPRCTKPVLDPDEIARALELAATGR
jgi:CheY-like chemotaxis protein